MLAFVLHILRFYLIFDLRSCADFNNQWCEALRLGICYFEEIPVSNQWRTKQNYIKQNPIFTKEDFVKRIWTCLWFYLTLIVSDRRNEFMCGLHLDCWEWMKKQSERKNPNPTNTQPSRRPFINSLRFDRHFWVVPDFSQNVTIICRNFSGKYVLSISKHLILQ